MSIFDGLGILQWVHHILSIKGCDAIRPTLNCFISMIISVDTLCGFAPSHTWSIGRNKGVYPQSNRSLATVDIDASKGFVDLWVHFNILCDFCYFRCKKRTKIT